MRIRKFLHSPFNPRSYKRSDYVYIPLTIYVILSIHAPTRGATEVSVSSIIKQSLSIHAPTRGATELHFS